MKQKRFLLLLAILLVISLIPFYSCGAENLTYRSSVYNNPGEPESGISGFDTVNAPENTKVLEGLSTLESGWYISLYDQGISHLEIKGEVNLILGDDSTLTITGESNNPDVKAGIHVPSGSTLNIYSQEQGTGKLIVSGGKYGAAIGSDMNETAGTIRIYGGRIEATAQSGAAIGTGKSSRLRPDFASFIQVFGGEVYATATENGAGLGGGENADGGTIEIYGGYVKASAKDGAGIGTGMMTQNLSDNTKTSILVLGGQVVSETSGMGAAMGSGGFRGYNDQLLSHNKKTVAIRITGGTVTATAGGKGAGIGTGYRHNKAEITLDGGKVTAKAEGYAAAIGGSENTKDIKITVNGGTVTAKGTKGGAGIGGYGGAGSLSVTVNNGKVDALATGKASAINGGGNAGDALVINGGIVTAKAEDGAAIGAESGSAIHVIQITGGTVTATSANGAGIGSGKEGSYYGSLLITGGEITASGSRALGLTEGSMLQAGNVSEFSVAGELEVLDKDGKEAKRVTRSSDKLTVAYANPSLTVKKGNGAQAASVFGDNNPVLVSCSLFLMVIALAVTGLAKKKRKSA